MTTEPTARPTAAEQAITGVLAKNIGSEYDPYEIADLARVVLAAAHGPLYEEVAQRLLAHAQDAEDHDATEAAVYTFMVAANQVREWASLPSLPVPSTDSN